MVKFLTLITNNEHKQNIILLDVTIHIYSPLCLTEGINNLISLVLGFTTRHKLSIVLKGRLDISIVWFLSCTVNCNLSSIPWVGLNTLITSKLSLRGGSCFYSKMAAVISKSARTTISCTRFNTAALGCLRACAKYGTYYHICEPYVSGQLEALRLGIEWVSKTLA